MLKEEKEEKEDKESGRGVPPAPEAGHIA